MGLQAGQTAALLDGAQRQLQGGNAAVIAANPWIVDLVTTEAARAALHQVGYALWKGAVPTPVSVSIFASVPVILSGGGTAQLLTCVHNDMVALGAAG